MSVVPVLKIGAVVVRESDQAVLIVQPKPKNAGEIPPYVLPRGSRQYALEVNGTTEWHDARDALTGMKHAKTLEPFSRGLEREIEEEAGITPAQLRRARVEVMGDMNFQSRTKGLYPVHWFKVTPDAATCEGLAKQVPSDALSVRWASLEEIRQMAEQKQFSAGYLPVIEKALALTRSTPGQSHHGAVARGR